MSPRKLIIQILLNFVNAYLQVLIVFLSCILQVLIMLKIFIENNNLKFHIKPNTPKIWECVNNIKYYNSIYGKICQ